MPASKAFSETSASREDSKASLLGGLDEKLTQKSSPPAV
jgi:hypothetical protein